jgi:hypothetical protein
MYPRKQMNELRSEQGRACSVRPHHTGASRGCTGYGMRTNDDRMCARSGGQVSRGDRRARYQHLAYEDQMVLVGGGDADAFAAL